MSNDLKKFVARTKISKEARLSLHQQIADSFEVVLTKNMNLFEERMYHLFKSRDYSKFKQNLSDIEHFLLMFNPTTKLDLFRYWKYLEGAGYEPVSEYCSSLEAYEIRSNPDAADLSKIIL